MVSEDVDVGKRGFDAMSEYEKLIGQVPDDCNKNPQQRREYFMQNPELQDAFLGLLDKTRTESAWDMEALICKMVHFGNIPLGFVKDNCEHFGLKSEDGLDRAQYHYAILDAYMAILGEMSNSAYRLDVEPKQYIDSMYLLFEQQYLEFLGFPAERCAEMTTASLGIISREDKSEGSFGETPKNRSISPLYYGEFLRRNINAASELGEDGVRELTEKCGILNYANYRPMRLREQLEWLRGDPDIASRYATQKDNVIVLLRDGVGDWNGALAESYTELRRLGPVLAFEIGSSVNPVEMVAGINEILEERKVYYFKLVIDGHGDSSGHGLQMGAYEITTRKVSSEAEIVWESPAITGLLRGVRPDTAGIRNVVISSCSQGKNEGGVAEIVAALAHNRTQESTETTVTALSKPSNMVFDADGAIRTANMGSLVQATTRDGKSIERREYSGSVAILDLALWAQKMKSSIEDVMTPYYESKTRVVV